MLLAVAMRSTPTGSLFLPVGFLRAPCFQACPPPLCLLTVQLVEGILKQCSPAQLAMLSSTCAFFHKSKLIEKIAKQRLKAVPRAKGIKPQRR